jgi:hypothetical protein
MKSLLGHDLMSLENFKQKQSFFKGCFKIRTQVAYTTKSITLQNSMNTHNFHITSIESTWHLIIHKSTIFWTNVITQQCNIGSTQTYWTYHNLVYFAFRLLNFNPQFIIASIDEPKKNSKWKLKKLFKKKFCFIYNVIVWKIHKF